MSHLDSAGLLARYGLNTHKSLGQNFLNDAAVLARIADAAFPLGARGVLEIGAGTGALTNLLCARAQRVVTVEIDRRLQPLLEQQVAAENHRFLWQDILCCDYEELLNAHFGGAAFTVVGNLPYYITTDILRQLLKNSRCWNCAVLMVQKEVADRLLCGPGSKEYRAISVILQAFCTAELLFNVPPHCFYPAPHVTSAVIRLYPGSIPVDDPAGFIQFVQSAFAARLKMFAGAPAVQQALQMKRAALEQILQSAGLPINSRSESFTPGDFIHVYKLAQKSFRNPDNL